jgi:hypothetical protein
MMTLLDRSLKKRIIAFILIFGSIIISIFIHGNEIATFLVFLMLIPVFAIFRFDGRIPLGYAIFLLIIAGILTFIKQGDLVDRLVIFSYWLLTVGISILLIDWFRGKSVN